MFTDNNYYLCTDIDKDGNFKIEAELPIEGNEELINKFRRGNKELSFQPIGDREDIIPIIARLESAGGRISRDDVAITQLRSRNEGDDSVYLAQSPESREDRRQVDFDRKEKAGRKLAERLNVDFEAVSSFDQIKNKDVIEAIRDHRGSFDHILDHWECPSMSESISR